MRELTVGKNLTAGSTNLVYTVPKGCKAIATLLMISNYGGNSKSVTAAWYDKTDNESVTIVGGHSISSGSYLMFSQGRMVMDEYDELRITPESGSSFSVIFTVEIHQNTSYQNGS
jgi:ABC-type spermidine/putrescine transport system permease subunit II